MRQIQLRSKRYVTWFRACSAELAEGPEELWKAQESGIGEMRADAERDSRPLPPADWDSRPLPPAVWINAQLLTFCVMRHDIKASELSWH